MAKQNYRSETMPERIQRMHYLYDNGPKPKHLDNRNIIDMENLGVKPKKFNQNLNFKISNMNMNIKIQYLKNSSKFLSPFWINEKKLNNYILPSFTKKMIKYLERN